MSRPACHKCNSKERDQHEKTARSAHLAIVQETYGAACALLDSVAYFGHVLGVGVFALQKATGRACEVSAAQRVASSLNAHQFLLSTFSGL